MPILNVTLWLLAGLLFVLLVLLSINIISRRYHGEHMANRYRTANGHAIERETAALQRQVKRPPLRRGLLPSAMPISPPKGKPEFTQVSDIIESRLRTREHIKSRAEWAARFDALHAGKRRPNPFCQGSRNHIVWFSYYEPAYLEKLAQMDMDGRLFPTPSRATEASAA